MGRVKVYLLKKKKSVICSKPHTVYEVANLMTTKRINFLLRIIRTLLYKVTMKNVLLPFIGSFEHFPPI